MSMLTPEEHLDAALGQLAPSRRAEAGPDDERAIADLERFLASVRREASSPGVVESGAAARVVEGVLGASTRQDLTWQGWMPTRTTWLTRAMACRTPIFCSRRQVSRAFRCFATRSMTHAGASSPLSFHVLPVHHLPVTWMPCEASRLRPIAWRR